MKAIHQKSFQIRAGSMHETDLLPSAWGHGEGDGQLAVDIIETPKELVVIAPMAGAAADRIEITIQHDLLTIRGFRSNPAARSTGGDYLHQECFWGNFSRSVVLPVEVNGALSKAELDQSILTVRIPKLSPHRRSVPINIKEE